VIISYMIPPLSQSAMFKRGCVFAKSEYRFRHLSIGRSSVCFSVRSYRNVLGNLRNDVIINYVASHVNSSQ